MNAGHRFILSMLVISFSQLSAHAQLASFDFTTANDAHNTANPNDVAANQTGTNASLAPVSDFVMNPLNPDPVNGPNGLEPGYPFGYTVSAATALFPTSLSGAESQGTYLTFSISPQAGASVNLTDIDFSSASFSSDFAGSNSQISGNPASGYTASLVSSTDGFTSDLGDILFNYSTSGTVISLSSSTFSDITTPTEFRLYFYGTPDGNEAQYVYLTIADGSTINVDGTVSAVPEPSTYTLLGIGFILLLAGLRIRRMTLAL